MADGKVKIGIDAGEYEKRIQQIKTDSMALGREMIQDARSYTTSAKETLDYLEQQIKAIERRNKLEIEGRKASLTGSLESGLITPEKYRSETGRINLESKEEKLQTQILRDLLTTIKENARRELVENRIAVEKRIQDSKTVDVLSPKGDPEELLKETIQKGELARVRSNEREEAYGAGLKRGISGVGQIAGSSNIYDAAMKAGQMGANRYTNAPGMLGVGAAAGAVLFALGGKAIQAAIPYEQALSRGTGQTGITFKEFGRGLENYGYTMDQTISERVSIAQARGRSKGSNEATINSLLMQRGLGISSGDVLSLESVLRGDVKDTTSRKAVLQAIGGMEVSGMAQKGDMSLLPEYLQTLISISQEQLNATGNIDVMMNTKMLSAISTLDDSFKNPQVLQNVVNSLRGGLSEAPSPQVQALQYSVLSRLTDKDGNPLNMSMFEMEEVRANPFGEKGRKYLPKYLEAIKEMSGGEGANPEHFYTNLMGMFNLKAPMARKLGEGFLTKNEDFQRIVETGSFESKVSVEGRAGAATGTIMESVAKFTNTFQSTGLTLADGMKDFITAVGEFKTGMEKIQQEDQKAKQKMVDEIQQAIDESNSVIEKAALTVTKSIMQLPVNPRSFM